MNSAAIAAQPAPAHDANAVLVEIDRIADQLATVVTGNFDFAIQSESTLSGIQKLNLMLNFLLDSVRHLKESEEKARAAQLDTIDRQLRAIQELSTPMLRLSRAARAVANAKVEG